MSEIQIAISEAIEALRKIKYGYCYCGCGKQTKIEEHNRYDRVYDKGEPRLYLKAHAINKRGGQANAVKTRRKERYTVNEDGCWIWFRTFPRTGYGCEQVCIDGSHKTFPAHILTYEKAKGPVPDGMELDHLCRNRACANPDHLEPVIHPVNVQRGLSAKLTPESVLSIRDRWSNQERSMEELAVEYNVHVETVRKVLLGETWRNIQSCNPNLKSLLETRRFRSNLTPELVLEIRARRATENLSYKALAEYYNCTPRQISRIIRRQRWINI